MPQARGPQPPSGRAEPDVIDVGSPIESSATWRVEAPTGPEGAGIVLPGRVLHREDLAAVAGWKITATVGVACLVLGLSVVWRGDLSDTVAGFWPPAGVGLVALLVVPRPRWGWVFAGILVPTAVGLAAGAMTVRAGLIWGVGNCVGPAVGATLLQRLSLANTPFRGRPLLTYLVCGPLAGPVVGGAVGSVGSVLDYDLPWTEAWLEWALADGLGVLVVTPLVLIRRDRVPHVRPRPELLALVLFVAVTSALAFVRIEGEGAALLPYLILVALVWAGMRFGPRFVAGAAFGMALAANIATSRDLGPWSGDADGGDAMALQAFLVVAIVTSIVVASMAAQLADGDEVNRLLRHQATHDALTGLSNRAAFVEQLGGVLRSSNPVAVSVLLLDVAGFHHINDRHGREVGDELLRAVADRMRARLGPGDHLARLGGDELVLARPGRPHHEAAELAAGLMADLDEVSVAGQRLRARVHVGIASVDPDDPISAGDLVLRADLALAEAKTRAAPSFAVFDEALEASRRRTTELTEELRGALGRQEITVAYQPVVDLATGRIVELEALARWTNRRFGVVGPDEFIPVAEGAGLIDDLGVEVLRQACRDLARWRRTEAPVEESLRVAVNVSPHQLAAPDLTGQVEAALSEAGLAADALTLEITETAVVQDLDAIGAVLTELRQAGVHIAMDDFGTGHSSMRNLRRIPLDVLKIDRSFVDGLGVSPEDTVIVESVIRLGHSFGLQIVAEGVETDAQRRRLAELGCNRGQGYLWSRPVPATEVPDLLRERPRERRAHTAD